MVSYTHNGVITNAYGMVLILVVVEDGLVLKSVRVSNVNGTVLILVVMEDGLVQLKQRNHGKDYFKSLNPCCNGRWSRTHFLE